MADGELMRFSASKAEHTRIWILRLSNNEQQHLAKLRDLLEARKYKDIKLEEAKPHNFVLGDSEGREIDVHVIVLDDNGNGIYGRAENGQMYPAASLTGVGMIDNCPVRCISPEWAVKFHSGYELQEKDLKDVSAICQKFGIELPDEYKYRSL